MWENIITGIVVMVLIAGIARYIVYRISDMEKKFVTHKEKEGTIRKNDERHERILRDLDKGDEKFTAIQQTLTKHGELLSSINSNFELYREFMEKRCKEMG